MCSTEFHDGSTQILVEEAISTSSTWIHATSTQIHVALTLCGVYMERYRIQNTIGERRARERTLGQTTYNLYLYSTTA